MPISNCRDTTCTAEVAVFPGMCVVYENKKVGSCHHGMARLQIAVGGTASNMEGSCEYVEEAVADSRQGVVLQSGAWARG